MCIRDRIQDRRIGGCGRVRLDRLPVLGVCPELVVNEIAERGVHRAELSLGPDKCRTDFRFTIASACCYTWFATQCANRVHVVVPEISRRIGTEMASIVPPQTYAGCTRPREALS